MFLTPEQRAVLMRDGAVSVSVDGVDCVVLRADVYDRLKQQSTPQNAARPREFDLDAPAGWISDAGDIDVDDYVS